MKTTLTPKTKLLFIGDSITDCGWKTDSDKLGAGYVRIIRDYLAAKNPAASPLILNRGISGNKIPDLQKRWKRDVLDLAPDILSIFIGINDVWHGLGPDRAGTNVQSYTTGYRDILTQTRSNLPNCQMVLCEPSVLWLPEFPAANEQLQPYIKSVHTLAEEFKAASIVKLHSAFVSANDQRSDIPWTTDGVHPASAGHMLIATQWLGATQML